MARPALYFTRFGGISTIPNISSNMVQLRVDFLISGIGAGGFFLTQI